MHSQPASDLENKPICWVLPYERDSGPANMALDHALLDRGREGGSDAFFRLYGWTVPTLSLGYFQAYGAIRPEWIEGGVAVVRRLTGGGAIWHDRELTYCLVLPKNHPRARPSSALYQIVHGAIAEALGSLGVGVDQIPEGRPRSGTLDRRFLCFSDPCEYDLTAGGAKVTGSAQRRRDGAVLQHGSILLAASPGLPELVGLNEARPGTTLEIESLAPRVTESIAAALGVTTRAAAPSDALRTHARELERSLYANPEWTRSR